MLLSTHIVADIESNCRQIAVLDQGGVRYSGDLADLQASGQGKVWEGLVEEGMFAELNPMSIVSTRRTDEGLLCRIIADAPPIGMEAAAVRPTLEDGYLALLRSRQEEGAMRPW